jgi:peptide/nickel transport system substrate-binding protein
MRRFVALALTLVFFVVAACSSDNGGKTTAGTTKTTASSGGSSTTGSDFNQAQFDGEPQIGGQITFGVESNIATLDPAGALAQPSDIVTALAIYDPMVTYKNGKYAGVLADSWTNSKDLKTWTFKLHKGITFTDGTPFNAQAVVTHTMRLKDPATACVCAPNVALISSVKATDANTVVYTLTQPNAFFPSQLTGPIGFIASPTALAKYGKDYGRHPVGTGPFSLKSFDSLELDKNPHYWQKDDKGRQLPYLDKIKIQPIPDAQVRLQSVDSGDVDIIQTADTGTVVKAVKEGKLKLQKVTGSSATTAIFNMRPGKPFSNKKMRLASAYGFDRQELNNTLYQGSRQEAYGPFAADSPFQSKKWQFPHLDKAKAKKLVAEAKAEGAQTKYTTTCIPTPEARQGLAITQKNANAIGFDVTNEFLDQGAYVNKVLGPTHDFVAGCFRQAQIADADGLYEILHTGGSGNPFGYSNPEVDKALEDIRKTTDEKEQIRLLDIVQKHLVQDVPFIPTLYDLFANIYNPKISGLPVPEAWSLGAIRVSTLYIKK